MQGDLSTDADAFAQMELSDSLLGVGDDGLLTGNSGQGINGFIQDLAVGGGSADTHVEHDLLETGNFHHVLVSKLLLQGRNDFFEIKLLHLVHVLPLDSLAGLDAHAGSLLAGFAHDTGTDRSVAFEEHHVGNVDRQFLFNDATSLIGLRRLFMTLADVHARNGHLTVLDTNHGAGLALVGTGNHLDVIILLDVCH